MYFTYHISFGNGSNPYFHFWDEKSLIKKSVYKWLKDKNFIFNNCIDIFSPHHKYQIMNSTSGKWYIKNSNHEYIKCFNCLGYALNYVEKLQEEN